MDFNERVIAKALMEGNSVASSFGLRDSLRQSGSAARAAIQRA
jgi:hypothetical protein